MTSEEALPTTIEELRQRALMSRKSKTAQEDSSASKEEGELSDTQSALPPSENENPRKKFKRKKLKKNVAFHPSVYYSPFYAPSMAPRVLAHSYFYPMPKMYQMDMRRPFLHPSTAAPASFESNFGQGFDDLTENLQTLGNDDFMNFDFSEAPFPAQNDSFFDFSMDAIDENVNGISIKEIEAQLIEPSSSSEKKNELAVDLDFESDAEALPEGEDVHRKMVMNTPKKTEFSEVAVQLFERELEKQRNMLLAEEEASKSIKAQLSKLSSKMNENEVLAEKGRVKLSELKEQMKLTSQIVSKCTLLKRNLSKELYTAEQSLEKKQKMISFLQSSVRKKEKVLSDLLQNKKKIEIDGSACDIVADLTAVSDISMNIDIESDSLPSSPLKKIQEVMPEPKTPVMRRIDKAEKKTPRNQGKTPKKDICTPSKSVTHGMFDSIVIDSAKKRKSIKHVKPNDGLSAFESHLVKVHKDILMNRIDLLEKTINIEKSKISNPVAADSSETVNLSVLISMIPEIIEPPSFDFTESTGSWIFETVQAIHYSMGYINSPDSLKLLFFTFPHLIEKNAIADVSNDNSAADIKAQRDYGIELIEKKLLTASVDRNFDVNKEFCSFELLGKCNDPSCRNQHFRAIQRTVTPTEALIKDFFDAGKWSMLGFDKSAACKFIQGLLEQLIKTTGTVCKISVLKNYLFNTSECCKNIPVSKELLSLNSVEKINFAPKCPFLLKPLHDFFTCISHKEKRYFETSGSDSFIQSISLIGCHEVKTWIENAIQQLPHVDLDSLHRVTPDSFDKSLNILSKALELNPKEPELWLYYLELFVYRGSYDECEELFEQALYYLPDCVPIWWKYFSFVKTMKSKEKLLRRMLCGVAKFSTDDNDRFKSSELAFDVITQFCKLYVDAGYYQECCCWLGAMLCEPLAVDSDFCERWTQLSVSIFSNIPESFNFKIEMTAISGMMDMKHVTSLFLLYLHLLEYSTYPQSFFNPYPYNFIAKRDYRFIINWQKQKKRPNLIVSLLDRLLEYNAGTEVEQRHDFVTVFYNIAALIRIEDNFESRNELLQIFYRNSKQFWFFPELHGILADLEIELNNIPAAIKVYNVALVELPREYSLWLRLSCCIIKEYKLNEFDLLCDLDYSLVCKGEHPYVRSDLQGLFLLKDKLIRCLLTLFEGFDISKKSLYLPSLFWSVKRLLGFEVPYSIPELAVMDSMKAYPESHYEIWMIYILASVVFKGFSSIFSEPIEAIFCLGLKRLKCRNERKILWLEYSAFSLQTSGISISNSVSLFEKIEKDCVTNIYPLLYCVDAEHSSLFVPLKNTGCLELFHDKIVCELSSKDHLLFYDLIEEKFAYFLNSFFRILEIRTKSMDKKKILKEMQRWNPYMEFMWTLNSLCESDKSVVGSIFATALEYLPYSYELYLSMLNSPFISKKEVLLLAAQNYVNTRVLQ